MSEKKIYVQWTPDWFGYFDYIRFVMAVDQKVGDVCRVVPVLDPDHSITKTIDYWGNTDRFRKEGVVNYEGQEGDELFATLRQRVIDSSEDLYVSGNLSPSWEDMSKYRWLITPNAKYRDIVLPRACKSSCGGHTTIHCRWLREHEGSIFPDNDSVRRYAAEIDKLLKGELAEQRVVLIGDNIKPLLADRFRSRCILPPSADASLEGQSFVHSAYPMSEAHLIDFWTDIRLLMTAKEVISICYFSYNSTGFSMIPALICGVPYRNIIPA